MHLHEEPDRGRITCIHAQLFEDVPRMFFQDAAGATVLHYTGLKVWDADGRVLPSHFEAAGETGACLLVDERGTRYPITIDLIARQAYLKPSAFGTAQAGDGFGLSVAVSGSTVVVAAYQETSSTTGVNSTPNESARFSGAACVFVRSAGVCPAEPDGGRLHPDPRRGEGHDTPARQLRPLPP